MYFSPLEQFDVIILKMISIKGYDFSLMSTVLPILITNILLFFLISFFKNNFKLLPDSWQLIFEMTYKFVFGIIKQQIGEKGFVYFPLLFTLFNFVFLCNFLSLVPFGMALTSHIILIIFLSVTISLSIFVIGLINYKLKFLMIFVPECPFFLLPILVPIEIFSYFIRMLSLAIRLTANIFAGHTLVFIISTFLLNVSLFHVIFFFLTVIPLIMILLLEFGVAFLQAYVFTILLSIYLSDSLNFEIH